MRYSTLAPGKRLRPVLCMVSAEAVGGSWEDAVDAACALELVHVFSLIHDDLPAIDDDDLRRGLPTCHRKFGEATAILAGDALFSLAFETMASLGGAKSRGVVGACIAALASAAGSHGLVAGEIVDVITEGHEYDEETLHYIHSHKTGALIAASCEIGGLLGGGTASQAAGLHDYGSWVGLAFQVADDILNETSSSQALGKATGSDRSRGKATYPALHGLEGAQQAARRYAERAVQCLPSDLVERSLLEHLAMFAIERTW